MGFFQDRDSVDQYTQMMEGYDNTFVIGAVENILPFHATLLELGMGTGLDLVSLSKKYKVVGSDYAPLFIADFQEKSNLEVCVLDAIQVDINRKFDCIYSNKVLQHLSPEDFVTSLKNQCNHLNHKGIIFMTLWHGSYREEYEQDGQLRFVYYDKNSLEKIIPSSLSFQFLLLYSEFEDDDSMAVVLGKK